MLRHFISFSVEHQSTGNHVLKRHTVEYHRGDGMQSKEPAAGLIHALVDEVGGERLVLVNQVAILERIVNLGIGHRAGVEPNVYQVGFALHLLATCGAKEDIIDIRPMQVYLIVVLLTHIARHETFILQRIAFHESSLDCLLYLVIQLFHATDAQLLAVLRPPDRQWGSPEA